MKMSSFLLMLYFISFLASVRGQNSKTINFNAANVSLLMDTTNDFYLAQFKQITNKFLGESPMRKLCVKNHGKCAGECLMVEKCVSFNFGKSPTCDGKHGCALLHEDIVSNANVLNSSGNYDYFSLNVSMVLWIAVMLTRSKKLKGYNWNKTEEVTIATNMKWTGKPKVKKKKEYGVIREPWLTRFV